ncbi:FUSC family protein [Pontibacter rugosus]|uniref:FUSC family membrane protein n=1 Tax=Pontibacter rugosus TaxID=1745966 RepID=A0ABW3SNM3_9BACT
MSEKAWTLRRFFLSEYFADGVRITVGVILPVLVFSLLGQLKLGIPVSMGALLASLSDAPGPVKHKRASILLCIATVLVVALLTGLAVQNKVLMGVEVLLFSFLFSMLAVYGNRAILIGTAGLLIMILVMGLNPENIFVFSGLVAGGGFWYLLLSSLFSGILPYRPAQHALGECIRETATFLKLRAGFYNPEIDLQENYRKVLIQQTVVSEKQDLVRDLLLRSRQLVKETTGYSKALLLTFVDVVDMYEQISAIHFDYEAIRKFIGNSSLPDKIGHFIQGMGNELNEIGWAIQSNARFKARHDLNHELQQLKLQVAQLRKSTDTDNSVVLERVLINFEHLLERFSHIQSYFENPQRNDVALGQELEYTKFVAQQEYDGKKFIDNLTLDSSIFRHSLRVAIASGFSYVLTITFNLGHHSYWVLLTIIVILKPAFSLTKQRNYQRLVGTVVGGAAGVLILSIVKEQTVLLVLLVIFMLGTFSLQRINYVVSVMFMTPFILIAFGFMGGGSSANIAQERILDTLLGSAIAFIASYTLFPNWESDKLSFFIKDILKANIAYLQKLRDSIAGTGVSTIDYKLARKDVYVYTANLSAAFQRMISEPKRKQKNVEAIHSFLVLNHILSSNISSVASLIQTNPQLNNVADYTEHLDEALRVLQQGVAQIELKQEAFLPNLNTTPLTASSENNMLLKEQLIFIQKVSYDICKASGAIIN